MKSNRKLEIKSLEEILNDNSEPPSAIVEDGILLDQTFLLIVGEQKARKSFLAYNFAIAISSGISFGDFKINNPHKVLFLSAEGGFYPNRARVKTMCANIDKNELVSENLSICNDARISLDSEEDIAYLEETIKEYRPKVLIIDPLVKFHASDENSANSMSKIFGKLRNLMTDYNMSLILVHHKGKNSGAGARGSSSILGEYDSSIDISKSKDNIHNLKFDMRHVETPTPFNIKFNPNTYWFESVKPKNQILSYVEKNNNLTKKELSDLLIADGTYKSSGGAYKAIKKEEDSGGIYLDGSYYKLKSQSRMSRNK